MSIPKKQKDPKDIMRNDLKVLEALGRRVSVKDAQYGEWFEGEGEHPEQAEEEVPVRVGQ